LNALLATVLTGAPQVREQPAAPLPLPPPPGREAIRAYLRAATLLNPEQIEKILAAAVLSIDNNLNLAAQALDEGDLVAFGRAAHTLKGTLLQCGLDSWAEQAQALHTGVREGRNLPFDELLAAIQGGLATLLND